MKKILILNLNYLIQENYQINPGINYYHISNGGMKLSDKGMNFPTLSVGMYYIFRPKMLHRQKKFPGLRNYNIGKLVSLEFSMKVHGHVAEHIDIRIGIKF